MKYVITGSSGHISSIIVRSLLQEGHHVTVIGRNETNLKALLTLGAVPAIGSVEDQEFLNAAFAGADAIYTMVPPNYGAADLKGYIEQVDKNYAAAIQANKIKHVVNLSSVGAHLSEGCGPVTGLHRGETALNAIEGLNILHLRPSYFYYNLLANVDMVKQLDIIGSNFGIGADRFPLSDPADIAEAATEALLKLDFKGHTVLYLSSDQTSTDEIASVLGAAIGKPGLKWIQFSDQQALDGMVQAGLPRPVSENYVEMGQALNDGRMLEDYWDHSPKTGNVKLKDFAKLFATVYNQ